MALNRETRRNLAKKGNIENVVTGAITETQQKIRFDTINDLMIMSLMVLHDKFGFGEKRLKKFHTEIANLGECLIAGTVNLDEIKEYLQENCKVKF